MELSLKSIGSRLMTLSVYLLALTIPVSIAGDNISMGIGLLGLVLFLVGGGKIDIPDVKPLLSFLAPEMISTAFSGSVLKTLKETSLNLNISPYFVVYDRLKKGLDIDKLLLFLSISSIALSFSVIFEAFTHMSIKHVDFDKLKIFTNPVRASGFFDHPLTSAGVIFILFFLFLILTFYGRKKIYGITSFFLLLALIFSQSRSYWIGFVVAIILFFIFIFRRKGFVFSAIVILIISALVLSVPTLKNRLESISDVKRNDSNTIRLTIWSSRLEAFKNDYSIKEKVFGSPVNGSEYACKYTVKNYERITGKKLKGNKNWCSVKFLNCLTHNIYLRYLSDYGGSVRYFV